MQDVRIPDGRDHDRTAVDREDLRALPQGSHPDGIGLGRGSVQGDAVVGPLLQVGRRVGERHGRSVAEAGADEHPPVIVLTAEEGVAVGDDVEIGGGVDDELAL